MSQHRQRKVLDAALGFAGGVMIAASYWSLLAPAIDAAQESGSHAPHPSPKSGFVRFQCCGCAQVGMERKGSGHFCRFRLGFCWAAALCLVHPFMLRPAAASIVRSLRLPLQLRIGSCQDQNLKRSNFCRWTPNQPSGRSSIHCGDSAADVAGLEISEAEDC